MELIWGGLIGLLIAVLVYEIYVWEPKLSAWLVELAVKLLPSADQDRYREQWKADLFDYPNSLVRLAHAATFFPAALRIAAETIKEAVADSQRDLKIAEAGTAAVRERMNEAARDFNAVTARLAEATARLNASKGRPPGDASTVGDVIKVAELTAEFVIATSRWRERKIPMVDSMRTEAQKLIESMRTARALMEDTQKNVSGRYVHPDEVLPIIHEVTTLVASPFLPGGALTLVDEEAEAEIDQLRSNIDAAAARLVALETATNYGAG
jgi:hypothetical protein